MNRLLTHQRGCRTERRCGLVWRIGRRGTGLDLGPSSHHLNTSGHTPSAAGLWRKCSNGQKWSNIWRPPGNQVIVSPTGKWLLASTTVKLVTKSHTVLRWKPCDCSQLPVVCMEDANMFANTCKLLAKFPVWVFRQPQQCANRTFSVLFFATDFTRRTRWTTHQPTSL